MVDHRVLLVVEEAMQADRTNKSGSRRSKSAPTAPRRSLPVLHEQGRTTRLPSDATDKMAALKQSGSEKDAIGYLMEIL